ncbi:MAG: glucuronate isomerase, partial [Cyclobacteriaceae bacterium]|nr:glucuronate isomerase [Cyclobacteriaceae bacterium]
MNEFLNENFLLKTDFAQRLYHNYAKDLPIIDYHCHLPPKEIA